MLPFRLPVLFAVSLCPGSRSVFWTHLTLVLLVDRKCGYGGGWGVRWGEVFLNCIQNFGEAFRRCSWACITDGKSQANHFLFFCL